MPLPEDEIGVLLAPVPRCARCAALAADWQQGRPPALGIALLLITNL
ncbi:hypothetical protein [Kitasatospora purpeofusca]|uniref:Uncharacterized protein n=1 Tax=Kitasatospora purpeofusca TaxID=67352 RepID=A0ABZ1TZ03_9ACTN|nr:hypothetical protein [Kitasatospora purpeofusca]